MVDWVNDSFTPMRDEDEDEAIRPAPQAPVDFLNDSFLPDRPTEAAPTVDWLNDSFVPERKQDVIAEEDEVGVDTGAKLKKDDLLRPENLEKIRNYMVARSGARYAESGTMTDEELVDDFVTKRRRFNTNIASTAGEVRFISKATEEQKAAAKEAYELYDQLGSVFVNDGFFGAVDGVKDYIFAAATDPSNYLGLLTGGAAKVGAFGGSAAAKKLVRKAAAEAGRAALKSGATREAAEKASKEAAEAAISQFTAANVKSEAATKAVKRVADLEYNIVLGQARRRASQEVYKADAKKRGRRALMATTAGDALIAMGQDYTIQGLMLDVGAQEEYSALQTGFSSLFGAVGGGAQLIGGRFVGDSGLGEVEATLGGSTKRAEVQENVAATIAKAKPLLDKEAQEKASKVIKESVLDWKKKWELGRAASQNVTTEADLLKLILLGEDGKGINGGLAKVYRDHGKKLPKGIHTADVMSNTVRFMSQKDLDAVNEALKGTHLTLGDMAHTKESLGNLIASEANRAGSILNVFSQTKRAIDMAVVQGSDILDAATAGVVAREAEASQRAKPLEYGQNLWRRLLVSSPATTAVNVAGFGQYYVGSTLADLFSGTAMTLAGLTKTGPKRAEYLRVGKVYRSMVAQKMRYLRDPFTTHDAYMEFLKQNDDVSKVLFETVSGGVERSAVRFGMDPDSKFFRNAEKLVDGANKWTGVRIQDTFTKSQMFMSEMDKYLRINKDTTLQDVINGGDVSLIDNDVIGAALDTTMKSVFSKDYTTDDQLLNGAAKLVENFSNVPGLGTVLPFGRFFNNVVATSYQWSVGGAVPVMQAIWRADKRNITTVEAASRSLVGVTGLILAMQNDEEKQRKGLAATEVEVGGGEVADMKNMFPLSMWLVAGRIGNLYRKGETIPAELQQLMLEQVAVGQLAKDAQFGNDLNSIISLLSDDEDTRAASFDALYKMGGNFAAGVTRPLDAINRAVGFINDSDVARDVRQETGAKVFTISATKYIDNIVEAFSTDIDAITGEELRVATRPGPLQDANPAARIAGIVIKPPQTSTELAFAMSEMLPYTANERSKNPTYDKVFNTLLQPMLEKAAENLMKGGKFKEASIDQRRLMLRGEMSRIKADLREYMKNTPENNMAIESMRRKAAAAGSKEARAAAKRHLEKQGSAAAIKAMGYKELQEYLEYVKAYDEYWSGK